MYHTNKTWGQKRKINNKVLILRGGGTAAAFDVLQKPLGISRFR